MDLDLNLIRSIVTVLAFAAFVALVVRVWRAANRERYADAAALPFADELATPSPQPSPANGRGSKTHTPPGQQQSGSSRLPLPLAGEGWGEGHRQGRHR